MTNHLQQEPSLSGAHQLLAPTSVKLGGDAALLHIMRMLNHADPRVSNRALFRLADLSNRSFPTQASKQVVEQLVHASLFDSRWHVYYLSARLLSLLEEPHYAQRLLVAALRARQPDLRARVLRILEKVATKDTEVIFIRSLTDSNLLVRAAAAEALGKIKSDRATPFLLEALNDAELNVQHSAVEALGHIRDPRSYSALMNIFEYDSTYQLRQAALTAIAKLGVSHAENLFLQALDAPDWRLRKCAVEGLAGLEQLSEATAYALARALIDPVNYIREIVAKLLAQLDGGTFNRTVVTTLQIYLNTHPSEHVRTLTARILGYQLEEDGVDFLITCLKNEDAFAVQRTIVRILERIGTTAASDAAYAWRTGSLQ